MGILRRDDEVDIDALRRLDLFATADDDELRRVAGLGDLVEVPEGTVLAEEDVFAGGDFFVIVEGTADVSKGGEKARSLEAGAFFGEMGALEQRKRSATVTAATEMEILVFTRMAFDQLIGDAPNVTRKIVREMGRRLRELEEGRAEG